MATRYEHYITGDDSGAGAWSTTWRAQTFTPQIAHTITSVKLLLFKVGTPGTVTVSIKATDADGKPTGADLCSGTTNGNTLPTAAPYEWREITFGSGYKLGASTKYAIVVRALSGNASNCPVWRIDTTTPTYTNGNDAYSQNTGGSWTATTYDLMFEEWGDELTAPTVTTQAVSHIAQTTARGNGTIVSIGSGAITQHGHCWSLTANPTTDNNKTTNGAGSVGAFISGITGLSIGTLYHVRAYATNAYGTGYGVNRTFSTLTTTLAQVQTLPATEVIEAQALSNGMVVDDAGFPGAVSFEWGITPDYGQETPWLSGFGTGVMFWALLYPLAPGTAYHFRARFRNKNGIVYGVDMAFTTLAAQGIAVLIDDAALLRFLEV